ncbi:MAG: sigma factor-like helix-turn-helix DNA-binding protein [Candidatus Gracilibacteria bacterium]|nr:sigma factor-like helix-turn-helix DNA-binding protein [Candidatus Gracilibacteria bacterium]
MAPVNNSSLASQTLAELDDLIENLLLLLSEKEKDVIQKRFSLGNERKHTLEEIGQEFSVTRERIRQIEKNALTKMKRNVFNSALKHLHDYIGDIMRDHGGLIREDEMHNRLSSISDQSKEICKGSLQLALSLSDELECVGNTINFHPYVKEKNISDYSLKHVSNNLVDYLIKKGDVEKLSRIHLSLEGALKEFSFDVNRTKSLACIDKRLTILDDDLVGLLEWRHIHPRTLRDKILYVLKSENRPLHFTYITEKISEFSFDQRPVNLQAVHNELIRHDQFVLIGRGIYALQDWGYERGTVAEVVLSILKEKTELDQEEIISLVLKQRQVKKITIVLALKNSELFERVGRRRYRLKGVK